MLQFNFGYVAFYRSASMSLFSLKSFSIRIDIDYANDNFIRNKSFLPLFFSHLFFLNRKSLFDEILFKMKRTISVSSPGKLILAGEHSVVYGRRALVTSIDMRLFMKLTEEIDASKTNSLKIHFHDQEKTFEIDLKQIETTYPMEIQAILHVYEQFKTKLSSESRFELEIRSEIPIGAGLGSSAAFSVCLVGCFFRLCHNEFDRNEINRFAYQVECLFHGTPSGIDNTISTYGQSLIYSRTEMKHLNFRLDNLAIIDTGVPKSTKRMVELVRQFSTTYPDEAEQLFDRIQSCVDRLIERPDLIDEMFRENQQILVRLGISIDEIDRIVRLLDEHQIACKITGGGGGGCLIASVLPSMKEKLNEILPDKKLFFVRCGVDGLREESNVFQ